MKRRVFLLVYVTLLCYPLMANVFYFHPNVGFVGDPMPFYDPIAKNFRVYYLQEFRPNGATYHPVYAVETTDLTSYQYKAQVLPTGGYHDQDAAIGTGSVVYCEKDQTYYFYYTGNKSEVGPNDSRQVVMYATSKDGINWTKTSFRLNGYDWYYYRDDFRDPEVFQTEDGLYHMLVATGKDRRNVLAEFTSSDCKNWSHKGIFMNTMWDRFYECPNVFKMGDWWYLIYSEQHRNVRRVQYFKSRTYAGLAECTKNDAGIWPDNHEGFLDSRGLYAGKTASDGNHRYLWGWCPTRPNNDNTAVNNGNGEPDWAGTMVAYQLVQHEDGSLTLGKIDNLRSYFNQSVLLPQTSMTMSSGQSQFFPAIEQQNHIHFTVTTSQNDAKFGVSVVRDPKTNTFYSVIVNPENNGLRKINFEQEGGRGFIEYIDGYFFTQPSNNVYNIDIYIDNSVFVMYVNDIASYTNRIYGMQSHQWSINCYSGEIQVTDIHQEKHTDTPSALWQQSADMNVQKRLENGRVIIYRNGKPYTIMGQPK